MTEVDGVRIFRTSTAILPQLYEFLTLKLWVFRSKKVWIMVYEGDMGYHPNFPANQLDGSKKTMGFHGLWVIRDMG